MRRLPVEAIRLLRQIQEALRCKACGKPTTVLNDNLARGKRGVHLQAVSAASHCACPPTDENPYGGPAYVPPGKRDSDFLYGEMVVRPPVE